MIPFPSAIAFTLFVPIGYTCPISRFGFHNADFRKAALVLGLPTLMRVAAMPAVTAIADKRGIAETLAFCVAAVLGDIRFSHLPTDSCRFLLAGFLS